AYLRAGGGVAQLGEHHVRNVGVEGSIPFSSTTYLFLSTNIYQGIEPASGADGQEPRPLPMGFLPAGVPRIDNRSGRKARRSIIRA
ncbi:MAG: hypothetical protein H6Q83_641, partial [Deltaproteobacteria bacterium]|nr:hypothetical protein [Deltaproteobacteria bacterium]